MLPANWSALLAFLTLGTQWRRGPMGHRIGLDYPAIEPTLRLMGIRKKTWPDTFQRLRLLEGAALEEIARRA